MKGALHCMNHTLYPVILLPVTVLVLAGATCMGYINFNENLLQLHKIGLIIVHTKGSISFGV